MPESTEKERLRPFSKTPYFKLKGIGIDGIPYAIEKIKHGDLELLTIVNDWTDGALMEAIIKNNITENQLINFCVNWWKENKVY